ncbi:hypothetical protein HZH66_001097 [Vespula vulgaris]|uniref:Uncharacterized protein n=1 Tax=Vespula vulgaris TaxID=7454 RepID=A0A834KY55_VESVU|nr:hypothetical protein HZH66_001097 [Vespula vulgaris]
MCHKNTIKSAKSGPERMLSHRCTQATPPMGLMLGIPWGIERLKYSPEEDTGSDDPRRSYCYVTPTVMNPPYTSVSYSESWPPTEYISKPATGSCKRCTVRITLCALYGVELFATKVKTLGLKVNEEAAFERMASRSCFRKNERALVIFLGISPDKSRNTLPDYDVP